MYITYTEIYKVEPSIYSCIYIYICKSSMYIYIYIFIEGSVNKVGRVWSVSGEEDCLDVRANGRV